MRLQQNSTVPALPVGIHYPTGLFDDMRVEGRIEAGSCLFPVAGIGIRS